MSAFLSVITHQPCYDVHTFVEHTTCADTDGYGYPFDCSGEAKNINLKAGTPCTGVGCNATTCCGACLR